MKEVLPMDAKYCGCCGEPTSDHVVCSERLTLEPPRYCPECRRRLKVQVTPMGWRAECSRHGSFAP